MTLQSADPRSLDGRKPVVFVYRWPAGATAFACVVADESAARMRAEDPALGWIARDFARDAYPPMVVDIDAP